MYVWRMSSLFLCNCRLIDLSAPREIKRKSCGPEWKKSSPPYRMTLLEMASIHNNRKQHHCWKKLWTDGPSVHRNVKGCHCWENSRAIPQKLKTTAVTWCSSSSSGYTPKRTDSRVSEMFHSHSHSSRQIEVAQVPIIELADQEKLIYICSGIELGPEKKYCLMLPCGWTLTIPWDRPVTKSWILSGCTL